MSTIILLIVTAIFFIWSIVKDKQKTVESLNLAKKLFQSTFVEVFALMALVALFLSWVPSSIIKNLLGNPNQLLSILFGAGIGTITIIPAFVAFPLAGSLLKSGANLVATAAFISTLTMVGFATLPIEIKYFGKKFAFARNALSIALAIIIALGMGVVLK
ncbi:putative permease [Clostridium tepidiprofundi DSM 19306]|uniref:Putative permease n=1 Tax=Clostridium tepidiprofundi DSM 19306 TaxID=1121338 RepID=A0A151B575_9CLOT|nr:permease [Clostridium tepidiprofundi]KYH35055.1 putative permease [Clostridium tepidiprofundi DSM 19306]